MDSFLLSALFAQINLARVLTTKKASMKIEASANLVCLWELRDSNPRPSACKADALNQLS